MPCKLPLKNNNEFNCAYILIDKYLPAASLKVSPIGNMASMVSSTWKLLSSLTRHKVTKISPAVVMIGLLLLLDY